MSTDYARGNKPPARPFPVLAWLTAVAVIGLIGGAGVLYVVRQDDTEIRNAAPVTRQVNMAPTKP
jgi:hypothetical protein